MLEKVKAVLVCAVLTIIGFLVGLWRGYEFISGLFPTPAANEGVLLFIYIATGLIGLFGAAIGYSVGRMITGME